MSLIFCDRCGFSWPAEQGMKCVLCARAAESVRASADETGSTPARPESARATGDEANLAPQQAEIDRATGDEDASIEVHPEYQDERLSLEEGMLLILELARAPTGVSIKRIAAETGWSYYQTRRVTHRLEAAGGLKLISTQRRGCKGGRWGSAFEGD